MIKTIEILQTGQNPQQEAVAIEQIGHDAWLNNANLRTIAASHNIDPAALALDAFNPRDETILQTTTHRIELGMDPANKTIYLLGRTAAKPGPTGFIHIQPEFDYEDSRLQTYKPDFVSINHIAVLLDAAKQDMATVLLYRALGMLHPDTQLSFYTLYDNIPVRAGAERIGFFGDSQEYEQKFLNDRIKLKCLRYIADSAGLVTKNMEEIKPELADLGADFVAGDN